MPFEEEDTWSRAIVISKSDGMYVCALIDYGTITITNQIKKLPAVYETIPEFTCVCETDVESVKKIQAGGDNVQFTVKSANTLILNVDGYKCTAVARKWDPSLPGKKEKLAQIIHNEPPVMRKLKDNDIIKIIGVVRDELLVQTKECHVGLKKLITDIASCEAEILEVPVEPRQLVLSPCEGESGLFRGIVEEIEDSRAKVYFVDYGNYDWVPLKNLRNINKDLAARDCNLIKVNNLRRFKGKDYGVEIASFLEKNLQAKYTVVLINESEVDFKCQNEDFLSHVLIGLTEKPKQTMSQKPLETTSTIAEKKESPVAMVSPKPTIETETTTSGNYDYLICIEVFDIFVHQVSLESS